MKTVFPTHGKYPFRMPETRFSLRHYDAAIMLFCVYDIFLRGEVETSDVERITHDRTLGKLHVHLLYEFRALCLGFDGRCCALRLDSETERTDVAQSHGVAILQGLDNFVL